ncbi:Endonuclease III [Serratia symbiotica]|nr:Endonuclease III [Serratia symbiotica]
MNQYKRLKILNRLHSINPNPHNELVYKTIFELLISVILSAKSSDISVNNITKKLYLVANTPTSFLELGIDNLKKYIKTLGLFNNKANNIIKTCHTLLKLYNGEVPENYIALTKLSGVGSKTANVILNTGFKWPTIAVDTHVYRVCNRTRFVTGKNVKCIEQKLFKVVPIKFKYNFHNWFVLLGRYICTAKKIKCNICIIKDLCEFKKKCLII